MMDKARIEYLKKDFVQGFPAYCGFEVERVAYGRFETRLKLRPEHRQQDGFAHAGLMATMADHTAGYAAFTTVSESFRILSIEFKINFFTQSGNTGTSQGRKINHQIRLKLINGIRHSVSQYQASFGVRIADFNSFV